jgi:hypothetical protein
MLIFLVQWSMHQENQLTSYAFTKYAVVNSIPNKDAQTVAKAIFEQWFCKFGIPADGGKEFMNKLLAELCEMLNVQQSKTTPYHPQCNSQVEVFNKTIKKYLASCVYAIMLNWDEFLPALMLAYNTSYHSTIATTPFELLFGMRPLLPSLPAPEIQRQHYGESFPAERLQMLQHACQIARRTAEQQGKKYKENFDQHAAPHKFKVDQKVWLSDTTALGKNPKLTPKWLGPCKIIDLNENNAKIEIKPNKLNIINISRLKAFHEEKPTCLCQDDSRLSQGDPGLFQDPNKIIPQRPMTRALKLIDYKNAAAMAISILQDELEEQCDGNIFAEGYDKYHCKNCYNGIKNFAHFSCQTNVFKDPRNLISQKFNHREGAFTSALCDLIKNYKYCKKDADQVQNDADPIKSDQLVVGAIKEALRSQLTSIASKLLSNEHTKLEDLLVEEQNLWRSFDNSDIYEFITGEPDCLPEFQFNWIEPCQLAAHLPLGVFFFNLWLQHSLQLRRSLQCQRSIQLHHSFQLHWCHQLLHQRSLQFKHNQHKHQFLGPVVLNNLPTPTIFGPVNLRTTKRSTLASSKDAESYVAKQKQ